MPICVLYNFLVRPSRSYGARRANSLRAKRKSTVIATWGGWRWASTRLSS